MGNWTESIAKIVTETRARLSRKAALSSLEETRAGSKHLDSDPFEGDLPSPPKDSNASTAMPSVVVEGQIKWTRNGQTCTIEVPEAATIAKKLVVISNTISLDPLTVAGHESFLFWRNTEAREARMAFETVLVDNLDFSSITFLEFVDTISINHFKKEADMSDTPAFDKLLEEVYGYLAGGLHSGANEAQLRAMLRDYDAVKAAWDVLTEYGRTHPVKAPPYRQGWGD